MNKRKAKHILKNTGYIGNEIGVALEVAIKSMDKLEQIEQIVKKYQFYKFDGFIKIKEVLEKE